MPSRRREFLGRRPFLEPAPASTELLDRAVHEIARDFPEALSTFRKLGIDMARVGGKRLAELPGSEELADALVRCSAWRPPR